MKIIVPKFVKYSIEDIGNKTAIESGFKIYAALYLRSKRKNSHGYFDVPSEYLESINKRYNRTINKLIEDGIIDYYKREIQDPNDVFKTITKKFYSSDKKICMKYKFLIDISKGDEIDIDMDSGKKKNWYRITKSSLEQLGYDNINISRDSFGRRVHHNLTQIYKEELKDKGYVVIDAKCSQPRLLYLMMRDRNIIDPQYNKIFEDGRDFYEYIVEKLDLLNRKAAKDLFMYWLNSSGYVPNYFINQLFPIASNFLSQLKNNHYKDSSATLQREESKIWIDDLLDNIQTNFALTIHDSLIVRGKDGFKTLHYCKNKYPEIEFEMSEL